MLLAAFGLSFPRGESPTPITVSVGSTGLQRVVRGGEEGAEGRRRHVPAIRAELRPPERGLVRLVADDELAHLRVTRGDAHDPGRERLGVAEPDSISRGGYGYTASTILIPCLAAIGHDAVEVLLVEDRRRGRSAASAR